MLFSRGIDPDLDDPSKCHDHPDVPDAWPEWDVVVGYKDGVRDGILKALRDGSLEEWKARLIVEHEAMHVETLYYMLAQSSYNITRTPWMKIDPVMPKEEWVQVPGGDASVGRPHPARDDRSFEAFGWDNEFDPTVKYVPDFEMAKHAVSVENYMSFIQDGGYEKPELWGDDWESVKKEGLQYPATWRMRETEAGVEMKVLTGVGPIDGTVDWASVPKWPVSLSLAEARAYARWRGHDIMTEDEYIRAAHGKEAVNRDVRLLSVSPDPVDAGEKSWCGVVGLVGNGWELTETLFDSFEGFEKMEEYPEYSSDFFDGLHFVLRGGSWCSVARTAWRNFYRHRYRYVFAKMRVVRRS